MSCYTKSAIRSPQSTVRSPPFTLNGVAAPAQQALITMTNHFLQKHHLGWLVHYFCAVIDLC